MKFKYFREAALKVDLVRCTDVTFNAPKLDDENPDTAPLLEVTANFNNFRRELLIEILRLFGLTVFLRAYVVVFLTPRGRTLIHLLAEMGAKRLQEQYLSDFEFASLTPLCELKPWITLCRNMEIEPDRWAIELRRMALAIVRYRRAIPDDQALLNLFPVTVNAKPCHYC
jgi:hypothetical protein